MKNKRFLYALLILFAINFACVKEVCVIEIDDIIVDNVDNNDISYKTSTLKFEAKVGSSTATSSSHSLRALYTPDTVALPEGRYVHIYVYDEGVTPLTGVPVNFAIYTATSAGVLSPLSSSYELTLDSVTYNLYALSEYNNSSDRTTSNVNSNMQGGEKTGLSKERDYLWWKQENVVVSDESTTSIGMLFNHICTKIQFNFTATTGDTLTYLGSGTLTGQLFLAYSLTFLLFIDSNDYTMLLKDS